MLRPRAILWASAAILVIAAAISFRFADRVEGMSDAPADVPAHDRSGQSEARVARTVAQDRAPTTSSVAPQRSLESARSRQFPSEPLMPESPARLLASARDLGEVIEATESWEPGISRNCVRSAALGACGFTRHMTTQASRRFDAASVDQARSFHDQWCKGFSQFQERFDADVLTELAELAMLMNDDGRLEFDGTEPRYTRDTYAVLELELETLSRFGADSGPEHYQTALRHVLELADPACGVGKGLLSIVDHHKQMTAFEALRDSSQTPESFREILELAIELRACRVSQACGPSSPVTMLACFNANRCRANESVHDLRRQTTSPEVFAAAERLAWKLDRFASEQPVSPLPDLPTPNGG